MARPIRIFKTEFDPALHLSPEELADYEAFEARLENLTEIEIRHYEYLMLNALGHYKESVKSIDKFLKS